MCHPGANAIEAARRASTRSAAVVHGELKRGVSSLATIASTAPWIGLFGTVLGIDNSFPGFGADRATIMAAIFQGLSESFVPAAMGLLVAVPALWFYKYLSGELEGLNMEMETASLELTNFLGIHVGRRVRRYHL